MGSHTTESRGSSLLRKQEPRNPFERKTQRRKDAEGSSPARVPGLSWSCTQRNPVDRRSCERQEPRNPFERKTQRRKDAEGSSPARTRFVVGLHTTESRGSSLLRRQEPRKSEDQRTTAVFGTLGYGFRPPNRVPGLSWNCTQRNPVIVAPAKAGAQKPKGPANNSGVWHIGLLDSGPESSTAVPFFRRSVRNIQMTVLTSQPSQPPTMKLGRREWFSAVDIHKRGG